MYNYKKEVLNDVKDYINNNIDFAEFSSIDELEEKLNDDLWIEDSVTGNGSGSYTFSTWQAEENLNHNFDLIEETAEAFGIEPVIKTGYEYGAEWWDVSIRCYLLADAISEALDEYSNYFER